MNENTTKEETLTALQAIQDTIKQSYQAEYNRYMLWFMKRRQKVLDEIATHRRPGILDRISTCESREAAHVMFYEFLDGANSVSQKTINRGIKLLKTLDFPLP